jgi:hypothetical protein
LLEQEFFIAKSPILLDNFSMKTLFLSLVLALFSLSLVSCNRNKVVAEVGSEKIKKGDVALAVKAMSIFSPGTDEKKALEQLIEGFTLIEILKTKPGLTLEPAAEEESKKLSSTKEGDSPLLKMKSVFGDEKTFRKLFLLPMVASRLAYTEVYLKDDEFHKPRKERAEMLLAEVQKKPAAFQELAEKSGLPYQKGTVSASEGVVWGPQADASLLPRGPKIAEEWKKAALDATPAGKIAPKLIEGETYWVVLKNLGPSAEKGKTDIAVSAITKEPFGVWLEKQKENIPIKRNAT